MHRQNEVRLKKSKHYHVKLANQRDGEIDGKLIRGSRKECREKWVQLCTATEQIIAKT